MLTLVYVTDNPTYIHITHTHTHTHTRLTALFLGLPGWAGTRKVKPIWISLKQETVSGSSISWAICKSARRSRQITTPAPHHSVFYRPGALPATQATASKHWRLILYIHIMQILIPTPKFKLYDHCHYAKYHQYIITLMKTTYFKAGRVSEL